MIGSRGATMAVDWEQRVDFVRLRADRLQRVRNALEASDLGAVLLFDQNNIRYVTSTHIGEWARDKSARCALLPRVIALLGDASPLVRAMAITSSSPACQPGVSSGGPWSKSATTAQSRSVGVL